MVTGVEKRHQSDVWGAAALEARVVRYADLVPCKNAFIDSRTPGSDQKENFTIIGPGVAENPEQFVHITEAHGFNIGGARQPPRCVNSQHSHETAEVFLVHTGRWRFTFGEHGDDAQVEAGPGDIVSFPVRVFRGFENIGEDVGFLWAVLGGDDPGRVLWAPEVFKMAKKFGLILLENGALVDTTMGQRPPEGVAQMPVTSQDAVAALRRMKPGDEKDVLSPAPDQEDAGEQLVIGTGGALPPVEGFTVSRLVLGAGMESELSASQHAEVVFVQSGSIEVRAGEASVKLGSGDTMTIPVGVERSYLAPESNAELVVVRGTP